MVGKKKREKEKSMDRMKKIESEQVLTCEHGERRREKEEKKKED